MAARLAAGTAERQNQIEKTIAAAAFFAAIAGIDITLPAANRKWREDFWSYPQMVAKYGDEKDAIDTAMAALAV